MRTSDDDRAALLAQALVALFEAQPQLRHPAVAGPPADRREAERRDTLLAWFEHGGASGAAVALRVHENTVRYRMQQASAEWDLRLDVPDEALALWASLAADRAARRDRAAS